MPEEITQRETKTDTTQEEKGRWRCKKCGYQGDKLVFTFNSYGYCIATNSEEPDYIEPYTPPCHDGDAEVGDTPIHCLNCGAWGDDNFEDTL